MLAIETESLSRSFSAVRAVDAVSLAVPEGAIFGFLGPNGAGKTTTIRMLLGLIRPDAGRVRIAGVDLITERSRALSKVGAIVEAPALYPNLTGRENLTLAARLIGADRKTVNARLDQVGLARDADRKTGGYSLGMRQRLALARALLSEPSLLILDEPTNGLDPAGINEMRELIRDLPRIAGATVFLSSHLLSEIEQTATHCALIARGRLIFQDTLTALRDRSATSIVVETPETERVTAYFSARGVCAEVSGDEVRADADLDALARATLVGDLVGAGIPVSGIRADRPNLESLFLDLVAHGEPAQ